MNKIHDFTFCHKEIHLLIFIYAITASPLTLSINSVVFAAIGKDRKKFMLHKNSYKSKRTFVACVQRI